MTTDEYWARIRNVPLIPERDSSDGESVICRAQDGTPVSVDKPDDFNDEERAAMARFYEDFYSPRLN